VNYFEIANVTGNREHSLILVRSQLRSDKFFKAQFINAQLSIVIIQ
jgi:gluconate kinase